MTEVKNEVDNRGSSLLSGKHSKPSSFQMGSKLIDSENVVQICPQSLTDNQ